MSETDTFTFVEKPYVASLEEKLAAAEARVAETEHELGQALLKQDDEIDLKKALYDAAARLVALDAFIADQRRWNDEHVKKLEARIAVLEAALAERRGEGS